MYQSQLERTCCPPWGLHGGKEAKANRIRVFRQDGAIETFPTGKVLPMRLEPGDGYISDMGGGGGFGDPLERDPERVLADVRSGYVSVASARDDYGVVIIQEGRKFRLDSEATAQLRARS
jgi:N-methylhydantoinase B